MADKILYPNAIDYIRVINANAVDNALGGRSAFLLLPSLYNRAYTVVHETGNLPLSGDIIAPNEATSSTRKTNVNIVTL